jgi:hypothetical protein
VGRGGGGLDDSRGLFLCAVEVMLPPSATPWRFEGGADGSVAAGTVGIGAVEEKEAEEAGMVIGDKDRDGDGDVVDDEDKDEDEDLTGWLRILIEDPSKFAERLALEHDAPSP